VSESLATVSYIGATILFILSLGGLSNPESSRRGNLYGMIGMTIAVLATVFGPRVVAAGIPWIVGCMVIGGSIGLYAARTVKMTQMPELVALMHSLVGLAAMLVGFANYIDPAASSHLTEAEKTIHEMEIYIGILIGAVTFSGSIIAFGKLSGKIGGKPVLLPARHWLNLAGLLIIIYFGREFLHAGSVDDGMKALIVMTVIALLFGIHMVMAIGGADMPVVISMLNSYSGWAAAATGFMLSNDLLIVTGALVGSSGAILSYIMCRAMNRHFISVIAGGFGTGGGTPAAKDAAQPAGEVTPISAEETAELLRVAAPDVVAERTESAVDETAAVRYLPLRQISSPRLGEPSVSHLSIGTIDVYVIRPLRDGWRVLVLQRALDTRCPTAWEAVHGHIEAGEEPEDAALREVREETGLETARLYNVTVQPFYLHRSHTVQLAVVFAAFVDEPAPLTLGSEHQRGEWLSVDAALDRFQWPREREALREIAHLLRGGDAGPVEDVLRVK